MLKELLDVKKSIEERMEVLQNELADVNRDINDALSAKLVELRSLQGKEFGTINLQFEGFKVTETISKKVTWDQDKLNDLFMRITESGDNPTNYMKMKLEVSEKMYESFDPGIRPIFDTARTVQGAKPILKIEVANA